MKSVRRMGRLALATFLVLGMAHAAVSAATSDRKDFCWKDAATRGVGTVPKACAPGRERIGRLHYDV